MACASSSNEGSSIGRDDSPPLDFVLEVSMFFLEKNSNLQTRDY